MPLYMLHGTCGSRVGSIMGHRDGQTIPTDPTLIGNIEHRCLSVLAVRWLERVCLILRSAVKAIVACSAVRRFPSGPLRNGYIRCAFEPYGLPAFGSEG